MTFWSRSTCRRVPTALEPDADRGGNRDRPSFCAAADHAKARDLGRLCGLAFTLRDFSILPLSTNVRTLMSAADSLMCRLRWRQAGVLTGACPGGVRGTILETTMSLNL